MQKLLGGSRAGGAGIQQAGLTQQANSADVANVNREAA